MVGSNLTYDNAYNRRIAEIVANYEKVDNFNKPQDFMAHLVGGARPKAYIQYGDTAYDNEAVFNNAGLEAGKSKSKKSKKDALVNKVVNEIDGYDGREPMVAGVNRRKKATKWLGFAKEVADTGLDLFDKVKSRVGGVNRRKKATKWLGFAKDVADTGLDLFDKVKSRVGGVNRRKKATKWLGFAKDVAETGLDLFDQVKSRVGGKPARKTKLAKDLKTVGRFLKPATEMLRPVGEALARRAVREIGGAKKSSPWIVHVKQYCAKHGCSYKEGLKLASPSYKK